MKPETAMRRQVVAVLRNANLDPQSIESSISAGVPDINWTHGWIELKCVESYPKMAVSPVRIRHFTPEQRSWALRRAACGGKVHLLLRVADDWYLFGTPGLVEVGELTKQQLRMRCLAHANSLSALNLPSLLSVH